MNTGGFLDAMANASRVRAATARARESLAALEARALNMPAAPPLRRETGGFDVIAEIKLAAPSAGSLRAVAGDPAARARAYAGAGACAVSVLTEPDRFGGSLAHLQAVTAALADSTTPAMRKDFLVDPYQVYEARAAGAGGVLVIVAMLDDTALDAMLLAAARCGLFVLIEAFDAADVARASAAIGRAPPVLCETGVLLGVNCRDLRTLAVDASRFERLAPSLPPDLPRVAESGLANADDVAAVAALGYEIALVGSALMREADPGPCLAALRAAGRRART